MRVVLHLMGKILGEQRGTLLACFLMTALFFTTATYLYDTFGDAQAAMVDRLSPGLVTAFLGGMFTGLDPLRMWLLTIYAHPLLLTLFATVVVAVSSRCLAGELDRGTIDLLLATPVARWKLVVACALVLLLALSAMGLLVWWSMRLGLLLAGVGDAPLGPFRWVVLNLVALFLASSGVAILFSASTSESGRATGRAVGFLVVSFFVNLIANLWERVEWMNTVSVFFYYRPQPVVTGEIAPWRDSAVLLAVAVVSLLVAVGVFARRDV